ncbi:MAG: transglutaminase domain-containing protein [Firmicutes bacterium]|nr:transglutaminase domain-containing protein [Bacillota bacterium]
MEEKDRYSSTAQRSPAERTTAGRSSSASRSTSAGRSSSATRSTSAGRSSYSASGSSARSSAASRSSASSGASTAGRSSGSGGKKRKVKLKKRAYVVFVLLIVLIVLLVSAIAHANVRRRVQIEAGSPIPGIEAFVKRNADKYTLATDLSGLDTAVPQIKIVKIKGGLFPLSSRLIIKDTIAPVVTAEDRKGALGQELKPDDFITSCEDKTAVTFSFGKKPDFKSTAVQNVEITATDAGKNSTTVKVTLELLDDKEPPVIEGVKNRTVYIGETIAYKAGVTVTDNMDPEPRLSIDNTQVDLDKVGVYPVTYTATDFCGNSTQVSINLKVEEQPIGYKNIEKMNKKVDALLAKIIKPEMTDIEKLYAAFLWIREHIEYQNGHAQFDYVNEAIKCLDGKPGDCYTCACGFRAMAEAMGFEIKEVVGTYVNHHFWVMVKLDGKWYHVDAVPLYIRNYVGFLGIDSELDWFSTDVRPGYYNRVKEDYPKTPDTTPVHVEYKNGQYVLTYN